MDDSEFLKQIGKRIKELRSEKGMTQAELAYKCNFEKQNMSRIEAGRTNPTSLTLLKISQSLEVDICELLPKF